GGDHIVLALLAAQEMVDAGFRKAEPVEGRRIEIAQARLPGRVERGLGILLRHGAIEIADGSCAEAHLGEGDALTRRGVEDSFLHGRFSPVVRSAKRSGLWRAKASSSVITEPRWHSMAWAAPAPS